MNSRTEAIKIRSKFAREIAFEAGRRTLDFFDASIAFDRKSDNTPVTVADREAEELLRKRIAQRFPEDAILGEEFGEVPGNSGFRWLLDPIDGTKSFITNVPLFGTLIGIELEQKSVVGVIELPALNKRVYAAEGLGAFWEDADRIPQEARVSNCDQLSDAVVLTSEVKTFEDRGSSHVFQTLENQCWFARTWGDCYGYFLVATGKADVMIDPEMSLWDSAALQPVIQEAGGRFCDWQGQPTIYSEDAVAANNSLIQSVLSITMENRPSGS